jgi:hypothetical protein
MEETRPGVSLLNDLLEKVEVAVELSASSYRSDEAAASICTETFRNKK